MKYEEYKNLLRNCLVIGAKKTCRKISYIKHGKNW